MTSFKHISQQVVIDEQQWSVYFNELKMESDRGAAILAAIRIDELLTRKFKSLFSKGNSDAREKLFGFNGLFSSFSSKTNAAFCLGWLDKNTYDDINLIRKIRNSFAHQLHASSFERSAMKDLINQFKIPRTHYYDWDELRVVANSDETSVIFYTGETPPDAGIELDFQRHKYVIILSLLVAEVGAKLGISIRRNSDKADSLFYKALQDFAFYIKENEGQLHLPFNKFLTDAVSALFGELQNIEMPEEFLRNRSDIMVDYGLSREGAFFGYVKLITPGIGADHSCFHGQDLDQFKLLSAIPNLILYTDGNEWALYRSGERASNIVRLSGDIKKDGKNAVTLSDAQSLGSLLFDFFLFEPVVPTDHRGNIVISTSSY